MEHNERFDKLENTVRETQESLLLLGKDVHIMSQSMLKMASSVEILVRLQQDIKVMEQRNEDRHAQLKQADKHIHERINELKEQKEAIEKQSRNGDIAYKILLFIAKSLGVIVIGGFASLVYFLITLKG